VHEKAVEKVKGKIKGALKRCEVVDNWPQYESFAQHVDALSKEILKNKSEWLSISDVYSIFYDLVYESITSKTNSDEKYSGLLCDLTGEEGLEELIDSLCGFYISIPRNYSIYFPLPKISKSIHSNVPLSETVEFVTFDKANEIPGGYHRGLLQPSNELDLNKAYLKFSLEGYCNNRLENKSIRAALSNFKIILQQGLFKGLFKIVEGQPAAYGLLGGSTHYQIPKLSLISVDQTDGEQRNVSTELPIEISKLLDSIDLDWTNDKVSTPFEKGEVELPIKGYLRFPALLTESSDLESSRVKAAIEWCLDSKANENETLSFLQICIGLETLLGDDESNGGLTETLADRCAYLISSDIKGRKTIKENFKKLYKIRSKIVHGVRTTIDQDQKFCKHWGHTILELAIIKEIKHLGLK
jgi:hypothetical protein